MSSGGINRSFWNGPIFASSSLCPKATCTIPNQIQAAPKEASTGFQLLWNSADNTGWQPVPVLLLTNTLALQPRTCRPGSGPEARDPGAGVGG